MSADPEVSKHDTVDDAVDAYEHEDFSTALSRFRRFAEQGDAIAQFYLGRMFSKGEAVVQDHAEAASWYLKSAEQGYFKAQHNLGMMYQSGEGVPRDPVAAASWWRRAAEQGISRSQFSLGCAYIHGAGVSQSYAEAVAWLRKAADQGDGDAEYTLGRLYLDGNGVPYDIVAAERLIRNAADRGIIRAQCSLATMYVYGQGVPQDDAEALKWYRKGAEHRDPDALRGLGLMHDAGRGVPLDAAEALSCFRQAADLGDYKAQAILGHKYQFGAGVTQDYVTACEFYRKAAERGHAEAQYALGGMYADALGVSLNYVEAAKWFRKAAEQGLAIAQFNLGLAYLHTQGVPQDLSAALYWFRQAADQGDSKAQNSLGLMYMNGHGTAQDYAAAAFWFHKAANQSNVRSQYQLSQLHFRGHGAPQDNVQAYFWLELARKGGEGSEDVAQLDAIADALGLVARQMTSNQIVEAQGLAKQWKPKSAAQSVNETAFAAARALRRADIVLAAYSSLPPGRWQGQQSVAGVEISFSDSEQAKVLLHEAKLAVEAGSSPAKIISLLNEAMRLDYIGALDGDAIALRAEFQSKLGLHEPEHAIELYSIGGLLSGLKLWREAGEVYRAAASLDPLLAWPLNNLAWMASTSSDLRAHSGQYAVVSAIEACEISGWGCWCFVGTLAAAFARAGDFGRAAQWQQVSLRLAPEKEKAEAQEMLRQFEVGQAYVDHGRKPAAGEARPSESELAGIDVEALISRAKELIAMSRTSVQ